MRYLVTILLVFGVTAGCVHQSSAPPLQTPNSEVETLPPPSATVSSPVAASQPPPILAPQSDSKSVAASSIPAPSQVPSKADAYGKTSVPPRNPSRLASTRSAAPPPATVPNTSKPQLDFKSLEQRLRDTSAIGVFTKLSIKNQVDDLLKAFRGYHAGQVPPSLDDLHQRFDGLLLKVVTLVQDGDATLASSISASRAAIWDKLSNRQSFEAI